MSDNSAGQIDHVLDESRLFPPPAEFTEKAVIRSEEEYEDLYSRARDDRDGFWRQEALDQMHWF